jgi:hypothetical protein
MSSDNTNLMAATEGVLYYPHSQSLNFNTGNSYKFKHIEPRTTVWQSNVLLLNDNQKNHKTMPTGFLFQINEY